VAIRTALIDREMQNAEYGVGGGIVWDSDYIDEYAEAVLKTRVLSDSQPEFSLLETMLWTPEEGYYLYKRHIDRLLDSANYFDFDISRINIEERLEEIASTFISPQRVRLLMDRAGDVKTESASFLSKETPIHAHLANQPLLSDNVFLFHKTTQREAYETARANLSDYDDVLLYNERGELTEFTIGNLVMELDGQLVTPPIECGLLAGTFRAYLLETHQVIEKIVPVHRLKDGTKYYRINSIRRWETVHISI
jgi:para-aminobenzoate synthetase/4-amino-4-deoxychorismate lyase